MIVFKRSLSLSFFFEFQLGVSNELDRACRLVDEWRWQSDGPGQNLTAQPALKTGLVGPNSLFKAKKIQAGHTGVGQIWLGFFRANNLMAQLDPNSGRTGLAHRVGLILPPQ